MVEGSLIAARPRPVNRMKARHPMLDPNHNASPLNPIPPIVGILVSAIAMIELGLQMGRLGLVGPPSAIGWRSQLNEAWGFSDGLFDWMRLNERYELGDLARFITYPFVHESFSHALFACVLLLAIGKFVGERFFGISVLVIFFFSAVVGAAAYSYIMNETVRLVGAYPGIYGLLGAFTWILWSKPGQSEAARLKAFQLVGFLLGLQLIFRLVFPGMPDTWVADLCGFLVGFALSFVLSPGGRNRLRDWLEGMRERG